MENNLGITKVNMQQKFLMSIEDHLHHRRFDLDQLWGWGKNEFGQLGSSGANFIKYPEKIKIPNIREN